MKNILGKLLIGVLLMVMIILCIVVGTMVGIVIRGESPRQVAERGQVANSSKDKSDNENTTETTEKTDNEDTTGAWEIRHYVDEFKRPLERTYVSNIEPSWFRI